MYPSNEKRAAWAEEGIRAYALAKSTTSRADYDPLEYLITDLLCDLMHLARRECVNFKNRLWIAEGHYEAELEEAGTTPSIEEETEGAR